MTTALRVGAGSKAIGLDIGGTKIAGGVVADDGTPLTKGPALPTPNSPDGILETLCAAVQQLRATHPDVAAVGVGAAGLVEWPEGHIRWAPNNSYHDLPLRRLLEDACGMPTVVDNDANVAAWAELKLGGGPNYMMFLTVGTGIGGGLVLGGQMYRGSVGIGGEIGHLIVDPYGGIRCGCGNIGCLEAVASGTAVAQYGREAAIADPSGMLAALPGAPGTMSGEDVCAAALAGDAVSRSIFTRVGDWLGVGIASLVNVLDLQRIVIGGGVAAGGDLLLGPARASLDRYLFARAHRQPPEVVLSRQGVDAGWIGAGLLALEQIQFAART